MELNESRYRILLAEDSDDDAELIRMELRPAGLDIEFLRAWAEDDFVDALSSSPDLVICDYAMPQFDAIRALALVRQLRPGLPLIVVSRAVGEETAVEAMRRGAVDYLLKDRLARLPEAVRRVLERSRLEREKILMEAALRDSQQLSRAIGAAVPLAIVQIDPQGTVVSRNWTSGEAPHGLADGRSYREVLRAAFCDPAQASAVEAGLQSVMDGRADQFGGDYRIDVDGERRCYHLRATRLGSGAGIVATIEDTTRKCRMEELLALRERAMECSSNAIAILDAAHHDAPVTYANRALAQITGMPASDILGRPFSSLFARGTDPQAVQRLLRNIAGRGEASGVLRCERRDGSVLWCDVRLGPVTDPDGKVTHVVAVLVDVTESRTYQEQLERASNYDALTELPNRNLLADRMQQALAGAHRQRAGVGVISIDIDRFKQVNDSYGHGVGDGVLRHVARLVCSRLQTSDTVARTGGDEFLAVVHGIEHESAFASLIEDLRRVIAEPVEVGGHMVALTVSLGAALYPRDGQNAESLQRSTGLALDRAKALGGNQWRFAGRDVHLRVREQLDLQTQLHRAVERNELCLFYQPVIDVASGHIIGAEALLRWTHPTRGLLLPADFIQLAERTGLIVPMGQWVLDAACSQLARWTAQGYGGLRVGVNVAARQFHDRGLVDGVRAALAQHQVAAERLELEISERFASHNDPATIAALDELKRAGVLLALDDFGVGATSISALTRLPVDRIKLDRRLINGLPDGSEERAIVSGVLGILRALGFTAVAEGVERPEQLELLRQLSCDEAQGFLLGRPVPPEQFEALLRG